MEQINLNNFNMHSIKSSLTIFIGLVALLGCESNPNGYTMIDLEEKIKKQNEESLSWEKFVDSVYTIADSNLESAINLIDQKMVTESNTNRLFDLHFIKGDIYYVYDSISKAVTEFTEAMPSEYEIYPKCLAARAGAYVKQKKCDRALYDLNRAITGNHDYLWNLGNYYEVARQKESAIDCYNKLYQYDTIIYKYCSVRINELQQKNPKLLDELVYKDRERYSLQMW
jgi:tetratricopeptide (TPR) repeat protein